ncbi:MAG: hypothetical protein Q7Q73_14670 [Verrucomicrobiota bacterium JB024]|nr:hypothetical protein [Verrucomicrobiota bacterium JB024]
MTAEIAILSPSGIALAADSAVTISNKKVYNTANKLFTLSKEQPVGIMIYDAADLWGIPWETIIKEFRQSLGNEKFASLSEYVDRWWNFLSSSRIVIPQETRDRYKNSMADPLLEEIKQQLDKKAQEHLAQAGSITDNKTKELFLELLTEYEKLILSAPYADGFDDKRFNEEKIEFVDTVEKSISNILSNLASLLNPQEKQKLTEICLKVYYVDYVIMRRTGIVIAGFGTDEIYPKIATYIFEAAYDKSIKKFFLTGKSNIDKDVFSTAITPFAQDEMVRTFICGIDPRIETFASLLLKDILSQLPDKLDPLKDSENENIVEKIKDSLKTAGPQLADAFAQRVSSYIQANNIDPIVGMVAALPKDELAAMAESLVNLTVFKRKVSGDIETVGGPIDVAVISKGDGFIWVKRKHYFKPELNLSFLRRYGINTCQYSQDEQQYV